MTRESAMPNLFIVGAPKCGTTAWVSYLSDHPDVFFATPKEPHYFCEDFPKLRYARTPGEYAAFFEGADGESVVGEASVRYLMSGVAARNIAAFAPDAKILIFLRARGAFLHSYHNQLVLNADEDVADFATAWKLAAGDAPRRVSPHLPEPKVLDYLAAARFAPQIRRYLDAFPARQVRVVHFEDWTRDPRATYLALMEFLDLEDDGRTAFAKVHTAKHDRFPALNQFLRHPPAPVRAGARLLKRVAGRDSLGVAERVRKLNRDAGHATPADPELLAEIDALFADDVAEVNRMVAEYGLSL